MIFRRLRTICTAWKQASEGDVNAYAADYKRELLEALVRERVSDLRQIERGLAGVTSDFLPNPSKFARSCLPSPEELGIPSESEAFQQAIGNATVKHPAVVFTLRKTDSWALKRAPADEAKRQWRDLWTATVRHVVDGGELPAKTLQIEDKPKPKASKDTAISAMDNLKGLFATG